MKVSLTLRAVHPGVDLKVIDDALDKYLARQVSVVDFPDPKPKRSLGWNGSVFLYSVLQKSKVLYLGAIGSWNLQNASSAFLNIRGHYEATAGLGHFLHHLERLYDGKITFDELDKILFKKSLGVRDDAWKRGEFIPPDAVNVLTQIDALDDAWQAMAHGQPPVYRKMYESLSEFCHLNFAGLTLHREINKDDGIDFDSDPVLRRDALGLAANALDLSLLVLFPIFDRALELLKKNEEMPTTR